MNLNSTMKKILVANRGEIAIRVMQTAKKMGIKTVAVFSTADRNAPHVKFADEAVCIGEAPSSQSYLLGDKIIEVAKELNVDGIHPGYGFLSENANFAEAVERAGITFIGPRSKAIKIMGSKLAAKDAVKAYNIPMVPGIDEAITDVGNKFCQHRVIINRHIHSLLKTVIHAYAFALRKLVHIKVAHAWREVVKRVFGIYTKFKCMASYGKVFLPNVHLLATGYLYLKLYKV